MADYGDLEYVGPCTCGRRERVVWRNKAITKSAIKVVCDGRLYRCRAPGSLEWKTWCRSRHFGPEDLNDDDKV